MTEKELTLREMLTSRVVQFLGFPVVSERKEGGVTPPYFVRNGNSFILYYKEEDHNNGGAPYGFDPLRDPHSALWLFMELGQRYDAIALTFAQGFKEKYLCSVTSKGKYFNGYGLTPSGAIVDLVIKIQESGD